MTTDESKVVMVTGVSSGFGQAIAAELQARGHRVFGTTRRPSATVPPGCSLVTLDVDDAVEAYTEALRMEVRPFGIHVAMVEPGDFATRFTANRLMTVAASSPQSPYAVRCATAVRRMVEDESSNPDIAPVVRAVVKAVEADRPCLRYPAAHAGRTAAAAAAAAVRVTGHGQLQDPLRAPCRRRILACRASKP